MDAKTTIEVKETVSATYRVEDKARAITANVRIAAGNRVEAIENGNVATDSNPNAATFNCWGEQNLSVTFNTPEGRATLHATIEAFIAELNANAETILN